MPPWCVAGANERPGHPLVKQEVKKLMNQFQGLNTTIFGGTILALIAGFFRDATPLNQRPLALWLFVAFFILLRLKIFWDDQQYFAKAVTKNGYFKIGLVIGVISWLVWASAAWTMINLRDAYFYVGVAIGISMLWIIADALRKGAYREQYFWIGTNTLFILLLWMLYRRNTPIGDVLTWSLLGGAIVIVIIDFFISKSVPELEH